MSRGLAAASCFTLVCALVVAATTAVPEGPVAWWSFDSVREGRIFDSARKTWDALTGRHALVDGVRGHALRLDGYTTGVLCPASGAPPLTDRFTIQAWVALQALPWNWTAIVDQGRLPVSAEVVPTNPAPQDESRVFLGIDAHGRVGFKVSVEGRFAECLSDRALPLLKWSLVTATFDEVEGLSLFLDGKPAGSLKPRGQITPMTGADILIGKSHRKLGPEGSERKASGDWPSVMVLEGLLDEVKIYPRMLAAEEIAGNYRRERPPDLQPLHWQALPAGPAHLPSRFDAVYTRLRYTEEWEEPWRVADHPDVLVHFDELPVRLLFWRGTGYGAAWVTENGRWMGDQSLERAGPGKSPWGCAEHMSDKQTRYSSVRIVEKNDARIVLQWRYAVADITYTIFGSDRGSGWGEWADEYYFVYPDGVSTRYQTLWTDRLSHEWQETIVINQAGTRPEDNVELDAMTLADMDGHYRTYSWADGPPADFSVPADANIQITNLKSRYRPFIVFEPKPAIKPFRAAIRPEYSHFPWWNHWPVTQLPNDGRRAMGPDRPSHSSLSQSVEDSSVIHKGNDGTYSVVTLIGMTDRPITDLVPLARSWNRPAELTVTAPGFVANGYDKRERAYVFERSSNGSATTLSCRLAASPESPLVNPALVVQGWGPATATVKVDGTRVEQGKNLRVGRLKSLTGDDLVVWLRLTAARTLTLNISMREAEDR